MIVLWKFKFNCCLIVLHSASIFQWDSNWQSSNGVDTYSSHYLWACESWNTSMQSIQLLLGNVFALYLWGGRHLSQSKISILSFLPKVLFLSSWHTLDQIHEWMSAFSPLRFCSLWSAAFPCELPSKLCFLKFLEPRQVISVWFLVFLVQNYSNAMKFIRPIIVLSTSLTSIRRSKGVFRGLLHLW